MQYLDNITRMIDEAGLSKDQESDALGRLVRVWEDPLSAPGTGTRLNYLTQYAYDGMANLLSVSQSGQTRTFGYDLVGRMVTAVNPESGAMTYQYDDAGNRTALIDGRGTLADQTVRFEFDTLNRLKKKTYRSTLNTPEVNYVYDTATRGVGLLGQVNVGPLTAGSNRYTIAEYDPRGMIKVGTQRVDTNNFRFESTYNLMGARTTLTYPSLNAYATAYDDAGRILSVSRGAQTYATVESGSNPASPTQNLPGYHASGAIQRLRMGTQLVEASVLNSRLQPSLIIVAKNGGSDVLGQLLYTYGPANNGNIVSQTIVTPQATRIHSYTYDRASRVESVRENGVAVGVAGWWQRYVYDAYGNRALSGEASGDPNPNNLAARIPLGPLAQVVTSTTPLTALFSGNRHTAARYDTVGNVIGYVGTGGSLDYLYDAENRLVCASKSGVGTCTPAVKPVEYVYDGYGRRVKKLVQGSAAVTYVYDLDGQLAAEVSSSSDPGLSYVFRDHLGSTRLTTDAVGGTLRRFDYTPFGEDLTADVNGRGPEYSAVAQLDTQALLTDRFTGQIRDAETGLDYFGARYMLGAQGRFTSPDPEGIGADAGSPQSWNAYSYGLNNPVRFVDPLGLAAEGVCGVLMGSPSCYGGNNRPTIGPPAGLPSGDEGPVQRPANAAIGWIKQTASDALDLLSGDKPTSTVQDLQWLLRPSNRRQEAGANASILAGTILLGSTLHRIGDLARSIRAHAFEKHVLNQGEFPDFIRTIKQFEDHVAKVTSDPASVRRSLSGNRTAYWHGDTGSLVIVNGNNPSKSTMFQPKTGRAYFDSLK